MIEDLPSYTAVLVVDMKDYSGHQSVEQPRLTGEIPNVLKRAFGNAGCLDLWNDRSFGESTGDGYAAGFPPEVLPTLVGPVLDGLQRELEYQDQELRTRGRHLRMRMRAAVAVGPLRSGNGATRVEAARLVDAQQVRDLLDRSDPDVTFVAAIISQRVHEDVVVGGYSPGRQFVPASVNVKTYQGNAYLHVPKPSGDLLASGFAKPKAHKEKQQPLGTVHNEFTGNAFGTVIQAGRIGEIRHDPKS
jgi:hypothetical protein